MATTEHVIKGTFSWAKVFESNKDGKKYDEASSSFVDDPDGGVYKIDVHLELDEFKKLKKTGSKSPQYSKEDESGLDVVTFKRPHIKRDRNGNILDWAGGAPKVVDEFGEPWDLEKNGWINNGAEGEVTISVYGKAPMVGTRLLEVKVLRNPEREDQEEAKSNEVAF